MTRAIPSTAMPQSVESVECSHCTLPVPRGLVRPDKPEQFCCPGCEMVYRTIHECGLADYYRLRDATTDERIRPDTKDLPFSEFDDPAFHAIYVQSDADDEARIELMLEGVHCAACVWLVERLPSVLPGVIEARLNLRRRIVEVRWDPQAIALSKIATTLNALGYRPHPAKGVSARQMQIAQERRMLVRIAIAGFCAGNVMVLSFALYGGAAEGLESQYGHLFRFLAMIFAIVSIVGPGGVFLRGAIAAIRTRSPHLDLPIAVALVAGGIWGIVNTFRGTGEVYFDSLTALVFLLLVGRYIQQRQQRAAADSVELLHAFTPRTAHLITDDGQRDVPVEALRPGDTVRVLAGELIPADGAVTEGASTLDASLLTGESKPAKVEVGEAVAAGAVNLTAPLTLVIEATGTETRVGRLMSLVAAAADRKAPLLTLANRIAGVFTVVVLVLAGVCFLVNLRLGADIAAERTIALLIVCCPCALGLATPLAMTSAIGRAARRGIMIKGSDALERLTHAGTMFLDKTGTITLGHFALVELLGDAASLPLAAALERQVSHPIAAAITEADGQDDADEPSPPLCASEAEHIPGLGVRGVIDGRRIMVGSPEAMHRAGITGFDAFTEAIDHAAQLGQTPVAIAIDNAARAIAILADRPRDDAPSAIMKLRSLGWTLNILSGDDSRVTQHIAAEVGIDADRAIGGVTPEDKLHTVEQTPGLRVMVGDGVNDAAALAAADVGIAVHGGSEASLEAADIYLNNPGLTPILETLRVARSTRRTIITCLCVSVFYNAGAATAAFMGFVGPIAAAVLMPMSSAVVLAIASRAGRIASQPKDSSGINQ
jgi:P-type Cu2+ transporter